MATNDFWRYGILRTNPASGTRLRSRRPPSLKETCQDHGSVMRVAGPAYSRIAKRATAIASASQKSERLGRPGESVGSGSSAACGPPGSSADGHHAARATWQRPLMHEGVFGRVMETITMICAAVTLPAAQWPLPRRSGGYGAAAIGEAGRDARAPNEPTARASNGWLVGYEPLPAPRFVSRARLRRIAEYFC